MEGKPAAAHEDGTLARHIAATLVELMELVANADAPLLAEHHKNVGECFVNMAVTANDQQWAAVLGSVTQLFSAQALVAWADGPVPEADQLADKMHALNLLKSARNELVAVSTSLPEQITDANNKALVLTFVNVGPVARFIQNAGDTWNLGAGVVAHAMLPLVLARTHEAKRIAKCGTNFKHWGDGITDHNDIAALSGTIWRSWRQHLCS